MGILYNMLSHYFHSTYITGVIPFSSITQQTIPPYMGESIVFYNLIGTLLLENNCTYVSGITLAWINKLVQLFK